MAMDVSWGAFWVIHKLLNCDWQCLIWSSLSLFCTGPFAWKVTQFRLKQRTTWLWPVSFIREHRNVLGRAPTFFKLSVEACFVFSLRCTFQGCRVGRQVASPISCCLREGGPFIKRAFAFVYVGLCLMWICKSLGLTGRWICWCQHQRSPDGCPGVTGINTV